MSKKFFLLFAYLLTGVVAFGQLYQKPKYPQNYFRWVTGLKPDIVANMGELRPNHWHMGLDVRTNQVVNQNVYAAADGYISFVGIEPLSWGRWVIIDHPNGLSTLYGHLNDFRDDLEKYVTEHQYKTESWITHLKIPPGRFPVKKGDFIAFSGTTGGSGGPHVHWEIIDTKSGKRLNPTLFGTPIVDNIPPTIVRIAMYDRSNSVYDQSPAIYPLSKSSGAYTVAGGVINTNFTKLSFAIQAYDTRNGTNNQDGIYSARLFMDGKEISSFYIDSVDYVDTRYMNAHIDYKMQSTGGSWMQHVSKLPGDLSGVYYDIGNNGIIELKDTDPHDIKIEVADANGNLSTISFKIKNNGGTPPSVKNYEWLPGRTNTLVKSHFSVTLPMNALYDKMNPNYSSSTSAALNSVSATHKIGETYIPVHSNFEVKIKPNKPIAPENRDRIVIKRTGKNTTVKKAEWKGEWLVAQFRDFGTFEAFVDNVPPSINSLGSGSVINLNNVKRITFTPTDNYGIADFRAEVDGKWIRFTNDKGRTWIYNFDNRIKPGEHTLTVTVTDIAGNITKRSWKFVRGVPAPAGATAPSGAKSATSTKKTTTPSKSATSKTTGSKTSKTTSKTSASKTTSSKTTASKTGTTTKKNTTTSKSAASSKSSGKSTSNNKTTTQKKK